MWHTWNHAHNEQHQTGHGQGFRVVKHLSDHLGTEILQGIRPGYHQRRGGGQE